MTNQTSDDWVKNLRQKIDDKKSLKRKIGRAAKQNKKITLGRDDVRLLTEILYDWKDDD